ncbi:MAG TPA: hypothetical protein VKR55_20545 [Bradyrhizobium sp.]|uniref:hypothetical protein n=1 Tax=Bradyrhizobium sp. TaxID=376 RepID=UPI002B7DF251|nr:hypothetical protein [Bradyrhizobium sp.]HLZ04521.1 hypothetical protein [Bradyrhizobium sp.]
MKRLRHLTVAALLLLATQPAFAADVTYPTGVRVGLTPLVGLSRAKTFSGFESDDHSVKVLVTELPADAFNEVKTAFSKPDAVGPTGIRPQTIDTAAGPAYYTVETAKDGATTVKRYSMMLSGGTFSGYVAVQIPENAAKIYSDDAVRQMFASAAVRKEVPVQEQLSMMPFKLTEFANFKNVRTLAPGAALVLADGDETTGFEPAPFMVIGIVGATPPEPGDRARFAQESATDIPGVRDWKMTMSEPIRVDGQQAYETRLDATSGKDNTAVTVVQWLIFGGPNMLRIIGSSPRDKWSEAFPRFRAVRDGIQPRG